jgi:hypothetical protein
MLDTVSVNCELPGLDVGRLEHRDWDSRATRSHKGGKVQQKVKAFVTLDNGAMCEYFASAGWLSVRAPLPRSWESLMT